MSRLRFRALVAVAVLGAVIVFARPQKEKAPSGVSRNTPAYTGDGQLRPPSNYREWIYLSSGLDMSYTPRVEGRAADSMFDNVFVNPEAYRSFTQTGKWPDETMLVLEVRGAEGNASINKAGHFQGKDVMGVEVHVKDIAHGGWAFYAFNGATPAKIIPKDASCYSCHLAHGAVDTTFVQFYPTLMPLAKQKGTLKPVE